jgi:uncharacterized protein
MLTLDITPLKPGLHELALEPSAEDLNLPPEEFDQIKVELRLDYQPHRLVVHLVATALAKLECDRTLDLYQEKIAGEHTLVFLPADQLEGAANGEAEDVRPLPEPDEPIDITIPSRDTLLLSLPARRVSPGAEDRDIKLVFGDTEDPTDPRWEALRRLRDDS